MSLLTLPPFLTRRKESVMPETTTPVATTPRILMRFLTQGGATVIVTGSGHYGAEDNRWTCLGCDQGTDRYSSGQHIRISRNEANTHAEKCRAMPKPEA